MKIQFFGCWNMWEIILKSVLKSGISSNHIFIKTKTKEKEDKLMEKYKVNIWIDLDTDIIILAIKPKNFNEVNLSKFKKDVLIISIMAWICVNKINFDKIIRIMPNTPLLANKWVIGFYRTKGVNLDELNLFKNIFEKNWILIEAHNEIEIDKITALSWSWPAYYYYLTEIIENKAISMWFSKQNAKLLVYNTFIWAAYLLENNDIDVNTLRKNITSPWWTTEEAIKTLKNNNYEQLINTAIDNAYNKTKYLNNLN